MKSFTVVAFFPEVKAHLAWQTAVVSASDISIAAKLALQEVRCRPGVLGKHISEVRLTIRTSPVANPEK